MGIRERRTQETKEMILSAALEHFSKNGFEGASLRSIAETAGISEPVILHHFTSKEALREAVLEMALEPMAESIAEIFNGSDGVLQKIEKALGALIDIYNVRRDEARFICLEVLLRPAEAQQALGNILPDTVTFMMELLQQGLQNGELAIDIDPFAFLQCAVVMTLSAQAALPILWDFFIPDIPEKEKRERIMGEVRKIILGVISAEKKRGP